MTLSSKHHCLNKRKRPLHSEVTGILRDVTLLFTKYRYRNRRIVRNAMWLFKKKFGYIYRKNI